MKQTLFFLFFFGAIILSCNKDNHIDDGSKAGYMEFKVNDTLYKVQLKHNYEDDLLRCDLAILGAGSPVTRYTILDYSDIRLELPIPTDSLRVGDYVVDTGTIRIYYDYHIVPLFEKESNLAQLSYNDDFMKVHISSNSNGLISGTFTAKFSTNEAYFDHSKSGRVVITDGKFTNVKIW